MATFSVEFDLSNLLATLVRSRRCTRCGSAMTVASTTRGATSDWVRHEDGVEYAPNRSRRRYRFRCAGCGTDVEPSRQPFRWSSAARSGR